MKYLTLVFVLSLSSVSWSAPKCAAFLMPQTEVTPIARISFSSKGENLSIAFSRSKTHFNTESTKKFLVGLGSFFEGKSTTTSRLEERSVIREDESKALLADSKLNWVARDQKNDGEDFTTITTYSGKFIMDSGSDVKISAKLRARKYYSHDTGQTDSSKMTSVFGSVGSLEIKISNVAGVDSDGFTAYPNSVFKPRVFIDDADLIKISKMNHENLSNSETRESLIEDLYLLEIEGKQMNPNLKQVTEFVDAVIALLKENPNLFEVQTVVAYNRDSYSESTENGSEYQYTLDRNIRIFEPDDNLNAENIKSYIDRAPLHKVEDGVAFAELKSPMIEKTENTQTYQELSHTLFSKHRTSFTKGKGKHSLGSKVRSTLAQTTLSEQLQTEGLLYYLIKGTGNLPKPPNRKHLVELGSWTIALPLTIDNKDHRIIFGYERNSDNGVKTEVLNSIKLIDALGRKVSLDSSGVKEIIEIALKNPEPSTITIDNQAITFPSIVKEDTVDKFTDFFDHFYTNHSKGQANPREIESLNFLDSKAHLDKYIFRLKVSNFLSWLKDRVYKLTPQLAGGAAIALTTGLLVKNTIETPVVHQPPVAITQHVGPQEGVQVLVKGEGFEEGLVAVVLPDGKIQILAVQPNNPKTVPEMTIKTDSIEGVLVNNEEAVSPGTIFLSRD